MRNAHERPCFSIEYLFKPDVWIRITTDESIAGARFSAAFYRNKGRTIRVLGPNGGEVPEELLTPTPEEAATIKKGAYSYS
jgi:hypothetical protein